MADVTWLMSIDSDANTLSTVVESELVEKPAQVNIKARIRLFLCSEASLLLQTVEESNMCIVIQKEDEEKSAAIPERAGDNSVLVGTTKKPIKSKRVPTPSSIHGQELDDEHEINGCLFWGNNWRQFTSVLPGILLLLTIGLHNVFTLYELDYFAIAETGRFKGTYKDRSAFDLIRTDGVDSPAKHRKSMIIVLIWYLGAILGSLLGAVLVRNMKMRSIYVSLTICTSILPLFISFFRFYSIWLHFYKLLPECAFASWKIQMKVICWAIHAKSQFD